MSGVNSGAAVLVLAIGAAALLYLSGSMDSNGEQDLSGDSLMDQATNDFSSLLGDAGFDSTPAPAPTMGGNVAAFLAMITQSEVGAALMAESDNGYNVNFGSVPGAPILFSDYSTHPNILVPIPNDPKNRSSSAAGAYQINNPTWQSLCKQMGLSDFSPQTQDAMAVQLITNKGALADVQAGNFTSACQKCGPVWSSLGFNNYGQPTHQLAQLQAWFQQAGGVVA